MNTKQAIGIIAETIAEQTDCTSSIEELLKVGRIVLDRIEPYIIQLEEEAVRSATYRMDDEDEEPT